MNKIVKRLFQIKSGLIKDLITLLILILVVTSVFLYVYSGFAHGLQFPLAPMYGDTVFVLEVFKQVESGHWMSDSLLGAPYGSDWADIPVMFWGHLAIIWLCIKCTSNLFAAFNVTFLVFMALAVLSMYYVARKMSLSRTSSAVAALFFSIQPFVFMRFPNHFFLLGFYWVPLLVLVAWQVASGAMRKGQQGDSWQKRVRKGHLWGALIITLPAVFVTGPYYAFYAALLIMTASVYAYISRNDRLSFCLGFGLALMIAVGFASSLLPNILYWNQHGRMSVIANRSAPESEIYGLKLKHLLLPSPYHRLPSFQKVTLLAEYDFPLENENASAKLGAWGALGFLFLLFSFMFKRYKDNRDSIRTDILGLFVVVLLLYANVGGFSSLFATFISPQLRGHSRVLVLLAVLAFLAGSWLVELFIKRIRSGWRKALSWGVLSLGLVLAFLDVVPPQRVPIEKHLFVKSIDNLAVMLNDMDKIFPRGAAFLQLPFSGFPEVPPSNNMEAYDHFWPRMLSDHFKWSFGLMKSSWQSQVVKQLSQMPCQQMALYLKAFGYSGIWLNRRGFSDDGQQMVSDLQAVFGHAVAVSGDGLYSVFAADGIPEEKFDNENDLVLFTRGWSGREFNDTDSWRWVTGASAEVLVVHPGTKPRPVQLCFQIRRVRSGNLTVKKDKQLLCKIGDQEEGVEIPLILKPGLNNFEFISDHKQGIRLVHNPKEKRKLNFSIVNLQFVQSNR